VGSKVGMCVRVTIKVATRACALLTTTVLATGHAVRVCTAGVH
jgi:hypothetical protein